MKTSIRMSGARVTRTGRPADRRRRRRRVAGRPRNATGPARRRRARAGRSRGWPRPRRRARARLPVDVDDARRRSSSCTHSASGSSIGSAVSTRPCKRLGRLAVVDARRSATIQRSWCGRDARPASGPVVVSSTAPGSTRSVRLVDEVDDDLAPEAVGLTIDPTSSSAWRRRGQSTNSTSTSTPSRDAAARTTVRIAWRRGRAADDPAHVAGATCTRRASTPRRPSLDVDLDRVGIVDDGLGQVLEHRPRVAAGCG